MFEKLIVLDLDETLLYATEEPLEKEADFRAYSYFCYKRPFVREFIAFCFSNFQSVGVWTSSGSVYALTVCEHLFGDSLKDLAFLWSSERCTRKFDAETCSAYWVKDLKKLKRQGFNLSKIIMIDDTPRKLYRQYGNLICVGMFEGQSDDKELYYLQAYLATLGKVKNVRKIEKRKWLSHTLENSKA